jgi:PRTRC genetic system protein E
MFAELIPLLEQVDLTLSLHLEDDQQIRIVVLPKRVDAQDDASLFTPLSLVATPAELDEQFADVLQSFAENRKSLVEQLAEANKIAKAAVEAAKDLAKKKADDARAAAAGKTKPAATIITAPPVASVAQSGATPPAAKATPAKKNALAKKTAAAMQATFSVLDTKYFAGMKRRQIDGMIKELLPPAYSVGTTTHSKPKVIGRLVETFRSAYERDGSLDAATIQRLTQWAESQNAAPATSDGSTSPGPAEPAAPTAAVA